jgi:hypothetical protein
MQHTTYILAFLHEPHTLTPRHVSQEVPGKVRDPRSNIACLALVLANHEPAFELRAEDAQIFIHERLQLERTLEAIKFLYWLKALGMILVAARAEEVLDEMAILKCIVDCRLVSLNIPSVSIGSVPE